MVEIEALAQQSEDAELSSMAQADLRCNASTRHYAMTSCRAALRDLDGMLEEAKQALVPPDSADEGSAIVEIRAGK